jgi:hypothetical protein
MNEKYRFQARYDWLFVNCSLQQDSFNTASTNTPECLKHEESGKASQIAQIVNRGLIVGNLGWEFQVTSRPN